MSELVEDVIIRDSDKQFRIRINGFLRSIGVSQIIGTKDYLDIEFIGGDSITVFYPNKLENFPEAIESELLSETQLSSIDIDSIKYYIREHTGDIQHLIHVIRTSPN